MRHSVFKRILDVVITITSLPFLVLPILLVAIFVRVNLGGPVLFRQERAGFLGQPFELIKFRTMIDEIGPDGLSRTDAERLTPFGRWLRATSLDELPELWNVVRGEMSIVGPRPLLMSYLPLYSSEQTRRHEVRPGITGWAQINGRNALSWERRFELDIWYVENRSVWLDFKIMFLTLKRVVMREGINAKGEATMPRFMGSK
jgi:lipopolysaccharide/colanic/teichoic acid biosynthesis glycosyltransferase